MRAASSATAWPRPMATAVAMGIGDSLLWRFTLQALPRGAARLGADSDDRGGPGRAPTRAPTRRRLGLGGAGRHIRGGPHRPCADRRPAKRPAGRCPAPIRPGPFRSRPGPARPGPSGAGESEACATPAGLGGPPSARLPGRWQAAARADCTKRGVRLDIRVGKSHPWSRDSESPWRHGQARRSQAQAAAPPRRGFHVRVRV